MLVYVDNVLAISQDPEEIMKKIGMQFEIKSDEYGPPKMYLGGDVEKFQLPDGRLAWSIHSASYVKSAIETVKALLKEEG